MIKRPLLIALMVIILGESITFIFDSIFIFLIIASILYTIKIITKKQAAFFVMIFFCLLIGFFGMSHSIRQRSHVSDAVRLHMAEGMVNKLSETDYGYTIFLNDVRIGKHHFDHWNAFVKHKPDVKMGQKIKVCGNISEYSSAGNFGNFDAKNYYETLGIFGTIDAETIQIVDSDDDGIRQFLFESKKQMEENLKKICAKATGIRSLNVGKEGIFSAMLLGEKAELDESVRALYSTSGIAHILAISGLHISMIGLLLYRILRKRFGFAVSSSISFLAVTAFCIMSGLSVATLRGMLMFGLKLLGEVLGRTYDYLTAISFAGILLLLENPLILRNSGFQMSFMAVIAICLVFPKIKQIYHLGGNTVGKKIISGILFSFMITIWMNPLTAANYFELPSYSFLLNLIVVPLMSLVILSGIASIAVSFFSIDVAGWFLLPGSSVLEFTNHLCSIIKKVPFSNVIVGKPPGITLVIYYGILAASILILSAVRFQYDKKQKGEQETIPEDGKEVQGKSVLQKKEKRICLKFGLAGLVIFLILTAALYVPMPKGFQTAFLDVGQGDGIFIRSDNGISFLIDGGSSSIDEVGKNRIIPFLKSEAVRKIDYAIVSHTDTDHISGLMEMLELSGPGEIVVRHLVLPDISNKAVQNQSGGYEQLIAMAEEKDIPVLFFSTGNTITAGNIVLQCIHPDQNTWAEDINDYSVVLSVTYQNFSMLLTGDISSAEEPRVFNQIKSSYTILKVAHHGSKYSTCPEFLNRMKPAYSIISVGKNNRYGHPGKEVLERLKSSGSKILRTDQDGGILVTSDGYGMKLLKMKK